MLEERESEVSAPPPEDISGVELEVDVFEMEVRRSESLIPRDKGDLVTEPGVIFGSSSILLT